jgi:uncharacterized phage-associated protein
MYNCFDISKEFLKLAKEDGSGIDTMKLLKLTYIAHGYYLGFYSKSLIENDVQAWKYGPVIPELYHVIKRFGNGRVDADLINLYSENKLVEKDKDFVKLIWNAYKKNNGLQLSSKTHEKDTPWDQVYETGVTNKVIDNTIIEDYYKNFINERRKSK